MTPAEHYAEAERLLAKLKDVPLRRSDGGELPWEVTASTIDNLLNHAQVHATLATAPTSWPEPPGLWDLLEPREVEVLRDAVVDACAVRNDTGVRASLLRSAAEKIGLKLT